MVPFAASGGTDLFPLRNGVIAAFRFYSNVLPAELNECFGRTFPRTSLPIFSDRVKPILFYLIQPLTIQVRSHNNPQD